MWNKKYLPVAIVALVIVIVLAIVFQPEHDNAQLTENLKIQAWQTKNGARVLFVAAKEIPMIDVRVVFNAGSARDGDKHGVAYLTNALLDNGAGTWNVNEVSERFDDVGAQFNTSSHRDMAIVHLRSLSDNNLMTKALDTMATVLKEPRFEDSEFERERQRLLVALHNQRESPEDLAELAFFNALYAQHPYASPAMGTVHSVTALSNADVKAFYQQYYVASNATVVIVGSVNMKTAESIAELVVGGLPKSVAAPVVPEVPTLTAKQEVKIQHPSTQTHIWVGEPGMTRDDPDYFPLYVGNHILGGSGFGSRIVDQIRESRGLAYSSYSYFSPMMRKGPFQMTLQTKNSQAQDALALLRQTLQEFIDKGPTDEELVAAKKNITGGFPLRLDSNKDITDQVASIGFYNLPLDYLKTFNDKVNAVTRQQIMDAFKRRVHPDTMVTVMVGNVDAAEKKP